MNPSCAMVPWPADGLAVQVIAGHFRIDNRHFCTGSRISQLSVHLYDYAADLQFPDQQIALVPGDVTVTAAGIESR